jgi:pseudouridine synthase
MPPERLQKLLAHAGVASRREAEELIRQGRVTVNGQPAGIGDKADPTTDSVKVDGRRIKVPAHARYYLLLNKPAGYLSTREDPAGRPTVMNLVAPPLRTRVVPVGRLDFDTEGLLLLTDDGDLAFRVAHPRYGCHKRYEVKVKGMPREEDLDRLRGGVVIEGKRTRPAVIEPLRVRRTREGENTWWTVVLSEGRSRQIREMFFRIGHPVQRLRRVGIGPLRGEGLALGAVRELTPLELDQLRAVVGLAVEGHAERATPRHRRPGRPRRER